MIFQVVPKLSYDPMREHRREMKAQRNRQLNEQLKQGDNNQQKELSAAEILANKDKLTMLQKRID